MSHDTEAAYAASEVADIIMRNQASFFGNWGQAGIWSVFAGREGGHQWPLADGVISAQNTSYRDIKIAFEFKRPNEGVHGILTALGQSFAYLEKGYDASIMVIPSKYSSHSSPGQHIKRVLDATTPDIPISIYTYGEPNLSATRPFQNILTCERPISLPGCRTVAHVAPVSSGNVTTLWAHMREGMSHPDAFYRYCQGVKITTVLGENLDGIRLPAELIRAVHRIDANADPYKYLSNTPGDTVSDKAWRFAWFNYLFWPDLMPIWSQQAPYVVNETKTRIRMSSENNLQQLFSGRSDSIKQKLVDRLNAGLINEDEAWDEYAVKVRKDAHSYREVIDSGLYHIGYLNPEGTLTELGYKFVEACERVGTPYIGIPMEIFKASILQNGQYGALLHYFYRLSEDKFNSDLFAFAEQDRNGDYKFNEQEYLAWINDYFANTLHIIKKSTERAHGTRKPFQAELPFLKKLGFIKTNGNRVAYRVGVGLEIDWPQVQNSMLYYQNL